MPASSNGVFTDQRFRSRAEQFQDNEAMERFTEPLRAVSTDNDGVAQRKLARGDRITVRDAQTAYVEGSTRQS